VRRGWIGELLGLGWEEEEEEEGRGGGKSGNDFGGRKRGRFKRGLVWYLTLMEFIRDPGSLISFFKSGSFAKAKTLNIFRCWETISFHQWRNGSVLETDLKRSCRHLNSL